MHLPRALFLLMFWVPVALAQNYSIDWYVIASGGGQTESGSYQVSGTIGQPIGGQASSDNYSVDAGFWVGVIPEEGDCVYIPATSTTTAPRWN